MVLTIVRWVLLLNGILALLSATVLYNPVRAVLIDPYLRIGARIAGAGPRPELPFFFRERAVRAWWLFMGLLLLAGWWYLGTADGAAWAANALKSSHA